jgi:hypothetical protein
MKNKLFVIWMLSVLLVLGVVGCDRDKLGTQPQIPDMNSVGCLITNDFYAVHFSVYVKTSVAPKDASDREALLKPYCQELPTIGKAFFSADLIDRDIRKTPIAIRVVELELTGSDESNPKDFKEVRTISEVPAKEYTKGVVEAQADIAKNGYYALYLLIGGEAAVSEEDRLRIAFHVGGDPDALPKKTLMMIIGGAAGGLIILIGGIWFWKKRKTNAVENA